MGSVWEAENTRLRSRVAVKFLAETFVGNDSLMARFAREATTAAAIRSPHVVQIHDHGTTETGRPYIVMELLEGESLAARIIRTGGLEPSDCERMVQHVCRALDKAHAAGLVHRDVKPENIFACDNDGEVLYKVLDFGVAKPREEAMSMSMTSTGMAIGTPYYMSPEQIVRAKDVDHRSDVWALGIVTYEALTGRRPFEADSIGGLAITIDRGQFDPATSVRTLPPGVDLFFKKAFAREIGERHQTAKDFANAFAQALRNDSRARIMSLVDDSLVTAPPGPRDTGRESFAETAKMSAEELERLGVNLTGPLPPPRKSQATPHATSVTAPGAPAPKATKRRSPAMAIAATVLLLAGVAAVVAVFLMGKDDRAPAAAAATASSVPSAAAPPATSSAPAAATSAPPAATTVPAAATSQAPSAPSGEPAPPGKPGGAKPGKPGKPGGKKDEYGF